MEDRLQKVESKIPVIESELTTITSTLGKVVDKLDVVATQVMTFASAHGNVSTRTLMALGAICVSVMGLGVTVTVIIGGMAEAPVEARLTKLEDRFDARDKDWEEHFYWKGRMDERTEGLRKTDLLQEETLLQLRTRLLGESNE